MNRTMPVGDIVGRKNLKKWDRIKENCIVMYVVENSHNVFFGS
jgi:hypothetical protein